MIHVRESTDDRNACLRSQRVEDLLAVHSSQDDIAEPRNDPESQTGLKKLKTYTEILSGLDQVHWLTVSCREVWRVKGGREEQEKLA